MEWKAWRTSRVSARASRAQFATSCCTAGLPCSIVCVAKAIRWWCWLQFPGSARYSRVDCTIELGIETLEELEVAAHDRRLENFPASAPNVSPAFAIPSRNASAAFAANDRTANIANHRLGVARRRSRISRESRCRNAEENRAAPFQSWAAKRGCRSAYRASWAPLHGTFFKYCSRT